MIPIWDATTFTKIAIGWLEGDIADAFLASARGHQGRRAAVGRALHGRWHVARGVGQSQSSNPRQRRTPRRTRRIRPVNFHDRTRRNDTHHSTTDPDARLYKKAAARSPVGVSRDLLTGNRHGLIVDTGSHRSHRDGRT